MPWPLPVELATSALVLPGLIGPIARFTFKTLVGSMLNVCLMINFRLRIGWT